MSINEHVTSQDSIDGAATIFQNEFEAILNFHAPLKTVQVRKNYCPFLSEETKISIKERNTLFEEARKSGIQFYYRNLKLSQRK